MAKARCTVICCRCTVICCSAVRVSARTECEERGVIPAPPNQILTQVPPGAGAPPAGGAPHGPPHNLPPLPEGAPPVPPQGGAAPPMAFMQALFAAWQQYNATVGGAGRPSPMGFPGAPPAGLHEVPPVQPFNNPFAAPDNVPDDAPWARYMGDIPDRILDYDARVDRVECRWPTRVPVRVCTQSEGEQLAGTS